MRPASRSTTPGAGVDVRLPLAGLFQVSNALVAAGLCIVTGTPADVAFEALEHLVGAPGRLERVGTRRGAPDLCRLCPTNPTRWQNVLATLRPYATGKLIVAFGLWRRPRSRQNALSWARSRPVWRIG